MVGNLALGSLGLIITPPAGITGVSVQMMAEIKKNIHYKPCKIKLNLIILSQWKIKNSFSYSTFVKTSQFYTL